MSFSASQSSNSRSNSITDDGTNELKNNSRESRSIQSEQWNSPEIQQIFEKVKKFEIKKKKNFIFYLFI
jgi:hypothetical protein